MRKPLLLVLAAMAAGCTSSEDPASGASSPSSTQAARPNCLRIVKSEVGNILDEKHPTFQKYLASCEEGKGHYKPGYISCIQQSPYSNVLDCASQARGIDRSKQDPALKDAKPGEHGNYSASAKEVLAVVYKGLDPRKSIDKHLLQMYLTRRDSSRETAGLAKIEDNHMPMNTDYSSFERDGRTYWVVRQTYQDLQLAKIMREDQNGSEEVLCARYGPTDEKLALNGGLCAGLLNKHFKITPP